MRPIPFGFGSRAGTPLIRMELQRHQHDAPSSRLWLWVTAIELLLIVVLLRLAS